MSEIPEFNPPADQLENSFESQLIRTTRSFPYPPVPDLSQAVLNRLASRRQRRTRRTLVVVGVLAALLLAVVLFVPPVRAAILEWIRIGAVRIFLVQPTPTATPTARPGNFATFVPTSEPTSTPLSSVLDLSGQTTLADAQSKSGFSIRLPAYPADLGLPDHVFVQDLGGTAVVLVWMDRAQPDHVKLSLTESASDTILFQKFAPKSIENATVNGQTALWMDGPYLLVSGAGDATYTRLVAAGHTLVWSDGQLSYRLEIRSDLVSAIRLAESLRPEP